MMSVIIANGCVSFQLQDFRRGEAIGYYRVMSQRLAVQLPRPLANYLYFPHLNQVVEDVLMLIGRYAARFF